MKPSVGDRLELSEAVMTGTTVLFYRDCNDLSLTYIHSTLLSFVASFVIFVLIIVQ